MPIRKSRLLLQCSFGISRHRFDTSLKLAFRTLLSANLPDDFRGTLASQFVYRPQSADEMQFAWELSTLKASTMKLLTITLKRRFTQIGRQENSKDPHVIAKFFSPVGTATWYAAEYYPEDNTCFGYVTGLGHNEWGYFSISELESVKVPPFGLSIERDLYFDECKFSSLRLK